MAATHLCTAPSSPYVEIWPLGNERKSSKGNHWYSLRIIIWYVCIIYPYHLSHLILKQTGEKGRANIIISNIRIWILMICSKEKEKYAHFFFFYVSWLKKKNRKIVLNDHLYVYIQTAFLIKCVSICKMLREDLITTESSIHSTNTHWILTYLLDVFCIPAVILKQLSFSWNFTLLKQSVPFPKLHLSPPHDLPLSTLFQTHTLCMANSTSTYIHTILLFKSQWFSFELLCPTSSCFKSWFSSLSFFLLVFIQWAWNRLKHAKNIIQLTTGGLKFENGVNFGFCLSRESKVLASLMC